MASTDKSPHEIAADLEDRLFRLYDRAGGPRFTRSGRGPNIVWTHEGPRLGRAIGREGDPALAAEVKSAELGLETFLRQYRPQLGAIPRWRAYYSDHDPMHDDGMPSVRDGFRYHVHLHAPGPSWRVPEIVYQARTLAEACTRALNQLHDNRTSSLSSGILVLDITDRLDISTPRLYLAGTLPALTDKLHTFAGEHTVALALRLAHSARRHQQLGIEQTGKSTAAQTMTTAAVGNEVEPEEPSESARIENLAARWAAAETDPKFRRSAETNPWQAPLEKAGVDPGRVLAEARRIDDAELATQSQHPRARYQATLLRSCITHYTSGPVGCTDPQRTELGTRTAQQIGFAITETAAANAIQSLIDTAPPHRDDIGYMPLTAPQEPPYQWSDISAIHHLEP